MKFLLTLSTLLARTSVKTGRVAAWAGFVLMLVIVADITSRRLFSTGSTMMQELEWHLHAALFLLCLGYGYIANTHVRIDVIRERLSTRSRHWIELVGCVVFLLPFYALMIYFGIDFVRLSFEQGEGSPNVGGLSHWWVIKSVMLLGFFVVVLAGTAVLLRLVVALFGDPDARIAAAEAEERQKL
ncbi:TRAP transporter small permease subunit [Methylibium sp.]|uniref:TRAP transporter small permease subunit n=1 Tax=Methylibium sp. TaxID=2067992 RepID=UPI0017D07646|nr:TRAP transporter small permease subunit [Methylibium sp.]MBA3589089.1 TRAP transporter small permease subunit [Methylibium sp.]